MTTTSTADNLYAIELIIEIDRGKYKTPFPAPEHHQPENSLCERVEECWKRRPFYDYHHPEQNVLVRQAVRPSPHGWGCGSIARRRRRTCFLWNRTTSTTTTTSADRRRANSMWQDTGQRVLLLAQHMMQAIDEPQTHQLHSNQRLMGHRMGS